MSVERGATAATPKSLCQAARSIAVIRRRHHRIARRLLWQPHAPSTILPKPNPTDLGKSPVRARDAWFSIDV